MKHSPQHRAANDVANAIHYSGMFAHVGILRGVAEKNSPTLVLVEHLDGSTWSITVEILDQT